MCVDVDAAMVDLGPYRDCRLCPRECGVDRVAGQRGYCGETAVCRVASVCRHRGEEPSFSGRLGSGTVFFSGCSGGCFFCQNHQISRGGVGTEVRFEHLVEEVLALLARGVHNLNFVTPDHFWPHVKALVHALRGAGVTCPFIYNCSGYQSPSLVAEIAERIDIFLPDLKFAEPDLARVCLGDPRYPDLALASIREMVRCRGFLDPWDPSGAEPARRGVLVRHLVMPGHVQNSIQVLSLLHREFGPGLPLSVMSQFRPVPDCYERGFLDRPLYPREYRQVCDAVEELGFEHVYIQPEFGDDGFVPDFEHDDPFPGNRDGPC